MSEIPEQFFQPIKNGWSYHPGWVTADGTLHSVQSHCDFKPRGYITANRLHKRDERKRGVYAPRNLSNYNFNWDRGAVRLCVRKDRVQIEYQSYVRANEWRRPLHEVLTERQAASLLRLCHALDRPIDILYGAPDKFHEHTIPTDRLHSAADILTEVPR